MLQEPKEAFEEKLPRLGVEVELVLVAKRLVIVGEEHRLDLDPLSPESLGEELGVRPQRIRVPDGDECRRECGRDVVGD